jgi:hypothetical protein
VEVAEKLGALLLVEGSEWSLVSAGAMRLWWRRQEPRSLALLGMTSVVREGFGDLVTDGLRGCSSKGAGAVKPDKMDRQRGS